MVDRAAGPVPGCPVGIVSVRRRTGSGSRSERYGCCARHGCRDGDARTGAVRFHGNNSGTDGDNHLKRTIACTYCGIHPYAGRHHAHTIIGRHSDPGAHIHPGTAQRVTRPTTTYAPSAELTFENRPPQGGTLVRLYADPPTLDPHLSDDLTSKLIIQEIFGGLVTINLDYQPVLDLAANCQINDDGTVYTFILRDNASFHDGKPVTAHDVKWSIERAADPTTLSPTAYDTLGDIVGVVDKLEGYADEVRGVRVIDDRTVEFEIHAPDSSFLAQLTLAAALVLD